ncbi:MAG: non-homologous end-joining DNA ligase [Acidimicrobiia bacterium]
MEVTNPDKPIFEADGHTKADLVGHYRRVGGRMIEFVAGRPLTLQRFPNGIEAGGFMQKNASGHFPDSIRRFEVPKQDGGTTTYPVVDRAEDLGYLANQGTVTFHMWTSTADRPDRPDWLVIDLDPEEGDLDGVRAATLAIGELLDEFGLGGFPLATGSSGFHVWVALDGEAGTEQVSTVARALAGLAAQRHSDLLTVEFLKKQRHGRVFVDWLRNGPTATVVAPFSLRPRAGAPVAVPVRWNEVGEVAPGRWTLDDLGDRLEIEIDRTSQRLPVDRIVKAAADAGIDLESAFDRFGRR